MPEQQQPQNPIPNSNIDPAALNLMKELLKETKGAKKDIDVMRIIVSAIVVVLLLGLGGIIQQYMSFRAATYQSLVDKITEQNVKVNLLYDSLDKANAELYQTNSDLIKLKTYFGIK